MTIIATVTGNVTSDVEPRISQAGKPWCNVRVASNPKVKDRQSGEWVDGEPMFVSIALFGQFAENAAQTLAKGVRVTATGKLRQRTYTDNQGTARTAFELYDVEAVGVELRFATATVTRAARGGSGASSGGGMGDWASPPANGAQNGFQGGGSFDDPSPF